MHSFDEDRPSEETLEGKGLKRTLRALGVINHSDKLAITPDNNPKSTDKALERRQSIMKKRSGIAMKEGVKRAVYR